MERIEHINEELIDLGAASVATLGGDEPGIELDGQKFVAGVADD